MKRNLASVLAGLLAVVTLGLSPAPADACGVKLTIKSTSPKKAVARTSRPSHVLLVGSPPRRLERDLTAAGHDVETTSSPANAKRDSYAVVIVDSSDQATAARQKYPDANVIVRSGDNGADLRTVENGVSRRPERVATNRTPVNTKADDRTPIATGPEKEPKRTVVAVKETTETPAAVTPPPAPTPAPTPEPAPKPAPVPDRITTQQKPVDETPAPKKVAKASASELHDEIYFTTASATINNKGKLARAVKWLSENSDVHVVVEGHADPTGSADANMTLSQTRAEAVKDYLVSTGIDGSRIEVIPYGDTKIKYGRSDGRNRRVAIQAKK